MGHLHSDGKWKTALIILGIALWITTSYAQTNDKVVIKNGGTADIKILITEQQGGDVKDNVFSGTRTSEITIGNHHSSQGAVVGFTQDRPPSVVTPLDWTTENLTVTLSFQDTLCVPVNLWILYRPKIMPDCNQDEGDEDTTEASPDTLCNAREAVFKTHQIWHKEGQGFCLNLGDDGIKDVSKEPPAIAFTSAGFTCGREKEPAFQNNYPPEPGKLNIYFVDSVVSDFTNNGERIEGPTWSTFCAGSLLIAMGSSSRPHVLAHELGHAFSLDHITFIPQFNNFFDTTNVMHPASELRAYLTEGQTLRSTINRGSFINNTQVKLRAPGSFVSPDQCGLSTEYTNVFCIPVQKRLWQDGGAGGKIWPPN